MSAAVCSPIIAILPNYGKSQGAALCQVLGATSPARLGLSRRRTNITTPRTLVFVVRSHSRRRIVTVNVTAHSTAAWTAQHLPGAWPRDTASRFVMRAS